MEILRRLIYSCLMVFQCLILLQAVLNTVEAQSQEEDFLIYTNRDLPSEGVIRADLNGANRRVLVNNMTASGVDYDFREDTLFWSTIGSSSGTIYKAYLNGSSPSVVVNDTLVPENIGWDWVNKKLYWTDVNRGTLEVIDPSTGYRKVLVHVGRNAQIRGLQLDPVRRWMYWTTVADGRGRIAKTSMDGEQEMILHDSNVVQLPNGITLDPVSDTLYWVDAGVTKNHVAKSSTDLGSKNMTVFQYSTRQNPFHTTFYEGKLYVTNWIGAYLSRLSLTSSPTSEQIVRVTGRLGMVTVVTDSTQQQSAIEANPCDDAVCTQLCLLSASDIRGYSCACTDGVDLNEDGYTCGDQPDTSTTSAPMTTPTTTQSTTTDRTSGEPILGQCSNVKCLNGGSCIDLPQTENGFNCNCVNGFSGTLCEISPPMATGTDDTVLILVLGILGFILVTFLIVGFILIAYWVMKTRFKKSRHHRGSSIDGLSTSSRDSNTHFVLVNGRMSEHDYMSIKSRGNSPAPSKILICNVGDQAIPNNYYYEQPQMMIRPPTSASQTLDHMFATGQRTPAEPIYNTVKATKRQTL